LEKYALINTELFVFFDNSSAGDKMKGTDEEIFF